jgi:hypothetical protein
MRYALTSTMMVLALCGSIHAQPVTQDEQDSKAGVLVMYPASAGFIYRLNNVLALRPDFSFSRTTSDYTPSPSQTTTRNEVNSLTFGFGALVYLHSWQTVRMYVSPRFGLGWSTSGYPMSHSTGKTYSGSASLGAEHVFNRRLGVFAEGGVQYDHKTVDGPGTTISRTWGLRAALGAVLYF